MATTKFSTIVGQTQVVPVVGPWEAYTPTFSGVTLGNGSVGGRWRRVGDSMQIQTALTLGTTSVVAGNMIPSIPNSMTPLAGTQNIAVGVAHQVDQSAVTAYVGQVVLLTTGSMLIGTTPSANAVSASVPFVWATTDLLRTDFTIPIVGWDAVVAQGAGLATANRPGLVYAAEDTTHISNFSGPFAATSATLSISKVNKEIVLMIPGISVNGNNTAAVIAMATPLPAAYRPAFSVRFFAPVRNNAVDQTVPGLVTIDTAGNIAIYLNNTGASFAAGTTATGIYATSLSYAAA